jgi:hypothetical protein
MGVGGNAYIGGYIAGLAMTDGNAYDAALYGTISASFIVEQIGLPKLEVNVDLSGSATASIRPGASEKRSLDVKAETWNGEAPESRLAQLRQRVDVGGRDV